MSLQCSNTEGVGERGRVDARGSSAKLGKKKGEERITLRQEGWRTKKKGARRGRLKGERGRQRRRKTRKFEYQTAGRP